MGKPWTTEEIEFITKHYKRLPTKEICEKINRPLFGVRKKCEKLKLVGRYTKNLDFFSRPTVENCLYAGFLAADGNISKDKSVISLCLARKDRDILESFARDISYTGRIRDGHYKNKNKTSTLAMYSSRKPCKDLETWFNIVPQKTFTLQPPNLTQDKHKASYIFGYFFGDGCLSVRKGRSPAYYRWEVYGNSAIVDWIKQTLRSWCPTLNDNALVKNRSAFFVRWGGYQAKLVQDTIISRLGGGGLHRLPYVMDRKIIGRKVVN